jgi:DNA-binding protein YbaB
MKKRLIILLCLSLVILGCSNSFVNEPTVTDLKITMHPSRMSYTVGESFSKAGLVVVATWSNGRTEAVTDYTLTWNNQVITEGNTDITSSGGTKRVSITYKDQTTAFNITIDEPVSSIAVTTQPTKTSYAAGESFTKAGLVITATYSDGSTAAVTGYSLSWNSVSLEEGNTDITASAGTKTVTVTYQGKTAAFDIAVNKTLSSIAVTTEPTKVSYSTGESFAKAGLIITATYSDGSTADVTGYSLSWNNETLEDGNTTITINVGTKTVTVTYQGKTAAFTISVTAGTVVTDLDMTSVVTAPSINETPQTAVGGQSQYSGSIAWTQSDGSTFAGNFAEGTAYKAEITLTASAGYSFIGLAAAAFTYIGASIDSVTNHGDSVVITIIFSALPSVVTDLDLSLLITAPLIGETPLISIEGQSQYSGSVVWSKVDGSAHSGIFAAGTAYKAEITLTASAGYSFTGLTAAAFTYIGAIIDNVINNGISVVITIIFPALPSIITDMDLSSLISFPILGMLPQSIIDEQSQYSGSITWSKADGSAFSGTFALLTSYKAVITLTPAEGYTFQGVAANAFTYTHNLLGILDLGGSITNEADSGIITIVFPGL